MGRFRKSSYTKREFFKGRHRFEHWYRDNTVYFITSKVRDGYFAFASEEAKAIFWDRFTYYCAKYDFIPWIVTLMINHYHIVAYLKRGENLGLRDVLQAHRAIRYTKLQAVRAGIVTDYRAYPHTRVYLHLDGGINRAAEIGAYLEDVPYARYERRRLRAKSPT